jgi:hypothetical protein
MTNRRANHASRETEKLIECPDPNFKIKRFDRQIANIL